MRKISVIWLAIVGMIIAACIPNGVDNVSLNSKAVPVIIRAEQIVEGETKTVRNVDKSVSWLGGEEINVICGADRAKFTSTNTEAAALVSFSGNLSAATVDAVNNGTSTYPIWGLYPYDENVESDGETYVTTTLPAAQTGVAGTFADELFITLAKSNNFNLSFYNVCSGFKFTVTKAGITSITIQGKNDEYIAGKVKLSMGGDGKPKVDEVIDGQKTITLTPENSTFEVGKDYYFVTLPTPFTSGFTVTFNTPSETGTFDVGVSVTFPRSKFVTKANVDENILYGAKVGNINIPDANFKAYCVSRFDKDSDGEVSYSEALSAKGMSFITDNIASLVGIEFFSNLTTLYCYGSSMDNRYIDGSGLLTSIDLSKNKALQYLYCNSNQITTLDLSGNPELLYIECYANKLSKLDVSNCHLLKSLVCTNNNFTSIDLSNVTQLMTLECDHNQLTSLDVTNMPNLQSLLCQVNLLTAIDLNSNAELLYLDCASNSLSELDVSHNPLLREIYCESNQLTVFDVSNNVNLDYLSCRANHQLAGLNVNNNLKLTHLDCNSTSLMALDVSNNDQLAFLDCGGNNIQNLNVSNNPKLTRLLCRFGDLRTLYLPSNLSQLDCGYNYISSLDLSACGELTSLKCDGNNLSVLIVSNNPLLSTLDCGDNKLSTLDVSENTALSSLICDGMQNLCIYVRGGQIFNTFLHHSTATIEEKGNPIPAGNIVFEDPNFKSFCTTNYDTNADGEISYAEALLVTSISCSSCSLTSLKGIESFTNLRALWCDNNSLTALDLSENVLIWQLYCNNNNLSTLNVSGCVKLTDLSCDQNSLSALNVSNNIALTYLYCPNNQLSSLDVSNNPALISLDCFKNQLSSLNISNNIALNYVMCSENQISSLDVTNNTLLTSLSCDSNQLTSLDVSKNTALTSLTCDNNQLSSLDVSDNTTLKYLVCGNNQLTNLNLNNNSLLLSCVCSNNLLTSLDVSNNTALTRLSCENNPYLAEVWLKTGQTINRFTYDTSVATIKYKE